MASFDGSYFIQLNKYRGVNGYKPVIEFSIKNWTIGFDFDRHADGRYEVVHIYFLCLIFHINKYMNY
jgi:hypothetical protein